MSNPDLTQQFIPTAKVLVVDDNMMTISIVQGLLQDLGFTNIETASNGQDAWDKISESQQQNQLYNIVVMDWNMPLLTGYEVLSRCREDHKMGRMAIMMLTAENQKRSILEATKAGATSYIVKPVEKQEFEEKIQQILGWIIKTRA